MIFFRPAKITVKCMEHNLDLINEPRFNEILVITNTTHKRKRKIYLHVANNCEHVIKDECQTDQQG